MGERTRRRFTREFKLEAVRQVVIEPPIFLDSGLA